MKKILITGGAGFIGSNLTEYFLGKKYFVRILDNFSTGTISNILPLFELFPDTFELQVGDIRNIEVCKQAAKGIDYILHEAALGSVPRSLKDPKTSNDVNISGFLNMLVAARDEGVNRFVYASSSSVYGDSAELPKVEERIGRPLSPYAITKYVNELYADIFYQSYGLECIGLRYFNVFGRRQNPNGEYASVIPRFIGQLINHESPIINGDGEYSRDFTYIDNVVQMNELAMLTNSKQAINQVFNTAYSERTTINELVELLKLYLSEFDFEISNIRPIHGSTRAGDIPHSLASIDKAKLILGYEPKFSIAQGLKEYCKWFWDNK